MTLFLTMNLIAHQLPSSPIVSIEAVIIIARGTINDRRYSHIKPNIVCKSLWAIKVLLFIIVHGFFTITSRHNSRSLALRTSDILSHIAFCGESRN